MWGGPAAQELIDVQGGDGIVGALRWWGHRWDCCEVPMVFVGGRVYRAAVMMWWACPSRTMWRSVQKSFGRWAVGRTVM